MVDAVRCLFLHGEAMSAEFQELAMDITGWLSAASQRGIHFVFLDGPQHVQRVVAAKNLLAKAVSQKA